MASLGRMLFVALAGIALVGCDMGARDVDYNPQRAISSDIDASLSTGPTSSNPGMNSANEPEGVFPWQIGQSRQ
ncbi:MAG TPA: hypothetical protein VL993_09880 [Stellaceae bacterium]|nr:hypothetical protein [Stellaceae bacterium]